MPSIPSPLVGATAALNDVGIAAPTLGLVPVGFAS
jgi:hypothetical protein